jgi:hypothetical protein
MNLTILICLCLTFYFWDYKSAINFSERNYSAFRKYEGNKALVWRVEQYKATGDKRFLIEGHISFLIISVFAALSLGGIGYVLFNLNFIIGVKMFLILQIIANIIGIITNEIAIKKFKEVKNGRISN